MSRVDALDMAIASLIRDKRKKGRSLESQAWYMEAIDRLTKLKRSIENQSYQQRKKYRRL